MAGEDKNQSWTSHLSLHDADIVWQERLCRHAVKPYMTPSSYAIDYLLKIVAKLLYKKRSYKKRRLFHRPHIHTVRSHKTISSSHPKKVCDLLSYSSFGGVLELRSLECPCWTDCWWIFLSSGTPYLQLSANLHNCHSCLELCIWQLHTVVSSPTIWLLTRLKNAG